MRTNKGYLYTKLIHFIDNKVPAHPSYKMEHITLMEKRIGADLGYHKSNLRPVNDEGCVGKSGLDKNLSLERILEIAYKMNPKPNVIIKAGPRAKWYLHP